MKKITIAILILLGSFSMVSAEIGLKIGVSGNLAIFHAEGKDQNNQTAGSDLIKEDDATGVAGYASFFAEKTLPGPYTFILEANNAIPKLFKNSKKEIGIRIPNNNIPREVVKELGNPIVTTSVKDDDLLLEYSTDPELIYEHFGKLVDMVIDGGYGEAVPSTIVDCTQNNSEIIRKGKGDITPFL